MPTAASICCVARALDVLGQKWTLLIVREAMYGRTRFAEFSSRLGIAPDVLTDRLNLLVENGIFERRSYRDEGARERGEYVLTDEGRDLMPVLASLAAWGNKYRPTEFGPAAVYRDAETDEPVRLAFLTDDRREVPVKGIAMVPVEFDLADA